jgi:hypothetical protein
MFCPVKKRTHFSVVTVVLLYCVNKIVSSGTVTEHEYGTGVIHKSLTYQ